MRTLTDAHGSTNSDRHNALVRAWVDGQLLSDPDAPAISVSDHGLTVGDGVFEAIKVVEGRPFALTRHLDRLATSAAGLGLPKPEESTVRRGIVEVLEAEHLQLGRVGGPYTPGPAPLGSGRGGAPPTLVVAAAAMNPPPPTTRVALVPGPRNERSGVPRR